MLVSVFGLEDFGLCGKGFLCWLVSWDGLCGKEILCWLVSGDELSGGLVGELGVLGLEIEVSPILTGVKRIK